MNNRSLSTVLSIAHCSRFIANIRLYSYSQASQRVDVFNGALRAGGVMYVIDDDSGSVRCQAFRHSRSYALAGTGDDRCSAIQIHHWTPCHIALLCHYPCLSPCYQPLLPATAQAYSISISNESLYASLPRSTSTARNRSMRLKPPS